MGDNQTNLLLFGLNLIFVLLRMPIGVMPDWNRFCGDSGKVPGLPGVGDAWNRARISLPQSWVTSSVPTLPFTNGVHLLSWGPDQWSVRSGRVWAIRIAGGLAVRIRLRMRWIFGGQRDLHWPVQRLWGKGPRCPEMNQRNNYDIELPRAQWRKLADRGADPSINSSDYIRDLAQVSINGLYLGGNGRRTVDSVRLREWSSLSVSS